MPRYLIWIAAICLLVLLLEEAAAYKGRTTEAQVRYMLGDIPPRMAGSLAWR